MLLQPNLTAFFSLSRKKCARASESPTILSKCESVMKFPFITSLFNVQAFSDLTQLLSSQCPTSKKPARFRGKKKTKKKQVCLNYEKMMQLEQREEQDLPHFWCQIVSFFDRWHIFMYIYLSNLSKEGVVNFFDLICCWCSITQASFYNSLFIRCCFVVVFHRDSMRKISFVIMWMSESFMFRDEFLRNKVNFNMMLDT